MLVIVVNQLTLEDQRYIKAIEGRVAKKAGDKPSIIIVHNFKDVESLEDAELLITKDITQAYAGKEKYDHNAKTKYWRQGNLIHAVLARDGSPAGKKWND